MESSIAMLLLVAALVIIFILIITALRTTGALKQKRLKNQQNLELLMEDQQERREYAQQSIRLLTLGAIDEQLPLIEACIRINGLFDFMGHDEARRQPYTVFADVAAKTRHIPTKDDWKALKRKEKRGHEQLMLGLEKQYKKEILAALARLKDSHYLKPDDVQQPHGQEQSQFYQA
jgi:type II secretory pathway pseudopilin PulG